MNYDEDVYYALSTVMRPELDYLVETYMKGTKGSLPGFLKWLGELKDNLK